MWLVLGVQMAVMINKVELAQEQEAAIPDMGDWWWNRRQPVISWDFIQAYHTTALNSCE